MDEIFTNYNGVDFTIKYILDKRPYIWGYYKTQDKIIVILTANLTDDPNVSFSKILFEIPILLEKTLEEQLRNNGEEEVTFTYGGNDITLKSNNYRKLNARNEAHLAMVEKMKSIDN